METMTVELTREEAELLAETAEMRSRGAMPGVWKAMVRAERKLLAALEQSGKEQG